MGEKVVGISLKAVRFLKKNNGITIKGLTPVVTVEELKKIIKELADERTEMQKLNCEGRKTQYNL